MAPTLETLMEAFLSDPRKKALFFWQSEARKQIGYLSDKWYLVKEKRVTGSLALVTRQVRCGIETQTNLVTAK
jgi:hypothetical protein